MSVHLSPASFLNTSALSVFSHVKSGWVEFLLVYKTRRTGIFEAFGVDIGMSGVFLLQFP
jgi:hypothetical protein